METAKLPYSLYFANSVHIGLLCIFDVFQKTITVVKRATFCGISVYPPVRNQGRRHGFESGGTNSASGASSFFDHPLFGQWGNKMLLI